MAKRLVQVSNHMAGLVLAITVASWNLTPASAQSLMERGKACIAPGSLDTSLSHAAGLSDIAVCHA